MKVVRSRAFLHTGIRKVFLAAFLSATFCGFTATYYVAPDGDDGAAGTSWATALKTITNGVAKAGVGDEVLLSNGVHYVTEFVVVNKSVTVRGCTGNPEDVIVNGNYPNTTNRCFYLANASAVVADLTVTNGFGARDDVYITSWSYGGGVLINGAGTLRNCMVTGNMSTNRGAGVYMNQGGLVTNCFLFGNVGGTNSCDGGGVFCYNGFVVNSTISNNFAKQGGGVYVSASIAGKGQIRDCDIVDNSSIARGGGAVTANTLCLITNCSIRNNVVLDGLYHGGGGVYLNAGVVANCTIVGNDGGPNGAGGGVRMWQANYQLMHDCIIVSNISARGGGVCFGGAKGLMRNCLIAWNSTTNIGSWGGGLGGGIYVNDSASTAVNCTVVANVGEEGAGGVNCAGYGNMVNCAIYTNWVCNGTNYNCYNFGASVTYSNCVTFPTAGLPGSGNIQADPKFVDPVGDFRLRTRSPCIDAGLNQSWMDTAVDLDGNPRRRDGSDVDIGCYEYEPPPSGTVFFGL